MKTLSFLFILICCLSCKNNKTENEKETKNDPIAMEDESSTVNKDTTTYYFIRHAEKDRKAETNDPHLTAEGMERAKFWAKHFANKNIEAVYSTNYKRTTETARPTAEQAEVTIELYEPTKLYSKEFKKNTQGKNVLVVGHSDTTPSFVNKILKSKKYSDIDDSDNAKLFIVTILPNGKVTSKVEDHPFE